MKAARPVRPVAGGRPAPGATGWDRAVPARDELRRLAAGHRVVPVCRRLLADGETPVGVYRKLAAGRPGTFLLESAGHAGAWSRYSFVGVRCPATLRADRSGVRWVGRPPAGLAAGGDPLTATRSALGGLVSPRLPGLPPLTGGLVGYLGYDLVRGLESLPEHARADLPVPDLMLMLATDLAVLDHADGSLLLIANALLDGDADAAHRDAVGRLDEMTEALLRPAPPTVTALPPPRLVEHTANMSRTQFLRSVHAAQRHIADGDVFQVVLSQRFAADTTADPLDVYRVLRSTNPSPYMYLLRFDDVDVVGSSPEALVKVNEGRARMHPIAGTRPRGGTPEEDATLAGQLLADPKERAEHVMLVDLGRNDLGRVARPGSVDVVDFMTVERYSHVMHLVSTVVAELHPDRSAFDAFTACFPAGTLTGAPKVRAMQLIDELEPTRRGPYGGAVGYLDFAGDLDTAIAIRTAVFTADRRVFVQAGAGIVADSDPAAEDRECRDKAAALLSAVAGAEALRPG